MMIEGLNALIANTAMFGFRSDGNLTNITELVLNHVFMFGPIKALEWGGA